jgi:hypothetical protein
MSEQEARKFAQTGHVDSPVRRTRPKLQENVDKSPARKGTPSTVFNFHLVWSHYGFIT